MIEGNFEKTQIQKDDFQCFKTIMGKAPHIPTPISCYSNYYPNKVVKAMP
jgi:hypothetical protein